MMTQTTISPHYTATTRPARAARRPDWRSLGAHLLRWILVVEVAMVLHIAYVQLTDRGTTYPPTPSSTTSIATTHVCGTQVCPR